jgi:hypothetical protein
MTGSELKYSDDSKILIRSFTGMVSFDDVMESWKWLIRNDMIGNDLLGILNDFTQADLKMDPGNLELLMGLFLEYPEIFKRIKLAVVMTIPENIVLPMLANKKYPQFKIQAFSTIPAAWDWLRKS